MKSLKRQGGWVGAAIGAAAGLLGAKKASDTSASSAARQIEFQREMSNTAHQRQVSDLRAAGLNPILSAKLGGASTPVGAQQQVIPNMGEAATAGAVNAMNINQMRVQQEQLKAQTKGIYLDNVSKGLEAMLKGAGGEGLSKLAEGLGLKENDPEAIKFMKELMKDIRELSRPATNARTTKRNSKHGWDGKYAPGDINKIRRSPKWLKNQNPSRTNEDK